MSRVAVLATTVLFGCSFHPGAAPSAGTDAPVGARPDAPPDTRPDAPPDAPSTCAEACNAFATCDVAQSPPKCVCNAGLSGDGVTSCTGPASCTGMADGDYTLYFGGDPSQPWTATCLAQDAYLPVSGSNFGQYTASMKTGGSDVRTTYTKLRIDPTLLQVDVDDQQFAESTGQLQHAGSLGSGNTVTSMPLGVAMDCTAANSETGLANVDLTGTPFTITSVYAAQGNNTGNAATTPAPDHRSIALTGGGNCGWTAVMDSPNNPFNTNGGNFILQLAYTPQ